jgi:glycopeptide antibiotics resistance protein
MYSGGIDPFPAFVFFSILSYLIVRIATRRNTDVRNFWVIVFVYVSLVIAVVLFPIPITREAIEYSRWRTQQGLGPINNFKIFSLIHSTWGSPAFVRQVGGNSALFIPFGVLINVKVRDWNWKVQTFLIAIAVTTTELLQVTATFLFGFRFRSFDVDDLWLNMLGGIFGLVSMKSILKNFPKFAVWLRRHRLMF